MALDRGAALFLVRQERRRDEEAKRRWLSASPHGLGSVLAGNPSSSPLSLRASGRFGISFSVPVAAGQLLTNVSNGRVIGNPALAANQIFRLGHLERGLTLAPEAAIAGTVKIYFLDNWLRPVEIASGVFT